MPKAKMPTRFLVLAAAGLAVAAVAACEAKPAATGPDGGVPRQVTVVGEGKVDGTPDVATINASIVSTAPDGATASEQTNTKMTQVIDTLKTQGIDQKDITTSDLSVQPQYGDNSVINGYTATNTITVKFRKIDELGPATTTIQTIGGNATRIDSPSFSFSDDSQMIKDARARAFNDAKDRASQYAGLAGLTLGQVISITEAGAAVPPPTPMPRFGTMEAAAAPPVQPGQQTVGFSVTVVWELA
jgi:uncharacterized protein YggE